MEEYKLIDIENKTLYFTHIIKTTTYNATISEDLFNSLPSFGLSNDINRIVIIYEISIINKTVDTLILQHHTNPQKINTANKDTINHLDSILKRYLIKGISKLAIIYDPIDIINNKGKMTIVEKVGNLVGERSFVRKYRLNVNTIIVGNVKDKFVDKEANAQIGFIEKKK